MTDTSALETFFSHLSDPEYPRHLQDEGYVRKYISDAKYYFAALIKEARENKGELLASGKETNQYFSDLLEKVDFNQDGVFKNIEGKVFHRFSEIEVGDRERDRFDLLGYINHSFNKTRSHFTALSGSVQNNLEVVKGKTTSIPSFSVSNGRISIAYGLYEGLKMSGYITCSQTNFLNCFTGMEVGTPIRWNKPISHLPYLIRRLCAEGLIVDPGKNDRIPLIRKVFVDENNHPFDTKKLEHPSSHVSVKKRNIPDLEALIKSI